MIEIFLVILVIVVVGIEGIVNCSIGYFLGLNFGGILRKMILLSYILV